MTVPNYSNTYYGPGSVLPEFSDHETWSEAVAVAISHLITGDNPATSAQVFRIADCGKLEPSCTLTLTGRNKVTLDMN